MFPNLSNISIFIISMLFSSLTWAHGEDKYGPNGGHIRMPGAFHTELVLKDKKTVEIFLLDMNFSNPVVTESSIDAKATLNGKPLSLSCTKTTNSFVCTSKQDLDNATISVVATRSKAKGNEATYKLPLPKLHGKHNTSENENAHHHH